MLPRERVLAALSRQVPDRVPKHIDFNTQFRLHFRSLDPAERFGLEVRKVQSGSTREQEGFERYLESLPQHLRVGDRQTLANYWQWGYDPVATAARQASGEYDLLQLHDYNPLAEARTIQDLQRYRFPAVARDVRFGELKRQVAALHRRGLAVLGDPPHLGGVIFETAQRLRGYYNLLLDFVLNKEFAHYLLDQITAMCAHNCALLARAGADVIILGDDVGEPTKMLISLPMWREFLKPRLARLIAAIREERPATLIMYHSDGYIEPIIPELIEIGVDVLEPVQPDVMDPAKLKTTYGDRLAFWGTVGVQTTWSATVATEAIRQEVGERIATVGHGGGLLIAPAYDVEPDVPWQNILAFLQAVEECGTQMNADERR